MKSEKLLSKNVRQGKIEILYIQVNSTVNNNYMCLINFLI